MQLNAFFMNLVQISILDGIALAVGAAFILAALCGIILARRTDLNITWGLGTIASLIIGAVLGFVVMTFFGYYFVWSGSNCYGLSGSDLANWTSLISTEFDSYPLQSLALSFIGALAGYAMGYVLVTTPKEGITPFGILISILGVAMLAIGISLTMMPGLLLLPLVLFYSFDVVFAVLFILGIVWVKRRGPPEEVVEVPVQDSDSA